MANSKPKLAKLLMVQGTSSGAGKSTLVLGLCRIFSNRGFRVSPFKAQNMSSKLFVLPDGRTIALAQAVQAAASRKEPDAMMNPILLKPLGSYKSRVFLDGMPYASEMQARDYYEKFALKEGLVAAVRALQSLRNECDVVVIEGAGSPAEVNIAKYDIANMILAEKVKAPVVIVADIERGGCFAAIAGTMRLIAPAHRKLVRGFIINKFTGDPTLLDGAVKYVEKLTKRKIIGIVPKVEFDLPDEDSLDSKDKHQSGIETLKQRNDMWDAQIEIIAKTIEQSIDMNAMMEVAGL